MNDVDIKNKRILLFDFDGTLKDGSIKYTSLYHESKENSDSLS